MINLTVEQDERLDKYLASVVKDQSRSKLVSWIDQGQVTVNGVVRKPSFRLVAGDVVEFSEPAATPIHDLEPADISLEIVYESDSMLVVNKPRGMATHPAPSLKEPSLVNALLSRTHSLSEEGGAFRPGIVHRLDKETTGLIMIAKTDVAHRHLAMQIELKTAERTYLCLANGDIEENSFVVDAPLGRDPRNRLRMAVRPDGKRAVTHFTKLARTDLGVYLEARLETGRTHQIRVHLKAIGHPVLGDRIYAPKELQGYPLQLHAAKLDFDEPSNGKRMTVSVEPPDDFLTKLRY